MAVITISRQYGEGGKTLGKMIADEGDVVVLGRGSQYILNDHPEAFHILMIDAFENRVRFMKAHYELSDREAAKVIRGEDKRARRFTKTRQNGL